jgi:hypothetical protein
MQGSLLIFTAYAFLLWMMNGIENRRLLLAAQEVGFVLLCRVRCSWSYYCKATIEMYE